MNIKEFAKLCGVSAATVSRYFSGQATISPHLAQKIEETAKATGYSPNPVFQRRVPGGNGIFAAVVPHWQHHFLLDLLQTLHQQCEDAGKTLLPLHTTPGRLETLMPLISKINPQGLFLLHEGSDETFFPALAGARIPMVMCGGLSFTRKVPSVHIDSIAAAYEGMNYLLGLGHKNIALISDESAAISSGSQRIMGCQKAATDAGVQLPQNRIAHAGNSFADGQAAMQCLLAQNSGITAVFAFNDDMATGAMCAIQAAGLRVPQDISVLGFDGGNRSLQTWPLLSTITQPIQQITSSSLQILLSQNKFSAISTVLGHSLTLRSSCGPVKNN